MEDLLAHLAGHFSADPPEMISTKNIDVARRGNVTSVLTLGPGGTVSSADLTNV